jgi:hypothetical protein
MKLIETKTLGTAAASIEFTSIPQDFDDLALLFSGRSTGSVTMTGWKVTINGSSSISFTHLLGTGSAATVSAGTDGYMGNLPGNLATSNTFGNVQLYFPNYRASTNKSFSLDNVAENNATLANQFIGAGLWSSTAAITSLAAYVTSNNIAIGSTISLYGITKGSDGIVTTS